jgi:hypothetical protein
MPTRPWIWIAFCLLAISRCSCEEDLSRIVDPPDAGAPDHDPGILLDAGHVSEPDASEPDATEEIDAGDPDTGTPDGGATIDELCDSLSHQTSSHTFTFADIGPCPWGQDDNLPLQGAMGWSARTEQIETITDVPPNAVICGANFEIPQTDMWFDDAMVIALSRVVLMTDVNISVFPNNGTFHFYDWSSLVGTGGSQLYCLGDCTLPAMETPGPMSLSTSDALARAIGEYAAQQGSYEIRVVTIGDNDAGDCRHQPFDFVVTLDYVVP